MNMVCLLRRDGLCWIARLLEQGHNVVAVLLGGDLYGRSSLLSSGIPLGTGFEQCLDHLDVASRRGPHQRGKTILTPDVRIDAPFEQPPYHVQTTVLSRPNQSSLPSLRKKQPELSQHDAPFQTVWSADGSFLPCFDPPGLGGVALRHGPVARLLVDQSTKTIGPHMLGIEPDDLGAVGDGQFKVAYVVIGPRSGEKGVSQRRTELDRLGEAVDGLIALLVFQVSDALLDRLRSPPVALFL